MTPTTSAGTAARSSGAAVATWPDAAGVAITPTTTAVPASATGTATGTATAAGRPVGAARPGRRTASTPGRLRLASALAALAGVLLAACGAWTLQARTTALHSAASDAAQLTRLQQIDTSLVRADAAVTNAFLVGGLEPASARAAYDDAIASATGLIAQAAAAQAADADALQALNQRLATYVALIEQARANNRQLLPLGSGYLSAASSWLRSDVLPVLDVLVATNSSRVDGEFASADRHEATFLGVGVLALGTLIALSVWHARRFHRVLSLPLAAGAAAALIATVAGMAVLITADGRADDVRAGSFAQSTAASRARTAGFDAKAMESLGLVNRGRGAVFEKQWATQSQEARAQAQAAGADGPGLISAWDAYQAAHRAIRADDDAGRWDAAVAKALASGTGSANATFETFSSLSADAVSSGATATDRGLRDARALLPWTAGGVILLGLIAAAGGVTGFTQRLREYQ